MTEADGSGPTDEPVAPHAATPGQPRAGEVGGDQSSGTSNQEELLSLALRPRAKGTPFVHWLYEEIRAAILQGRLSPGSRLPSRSALACRYRVSIGTVIKAFDRLLKQGYVDASVGRGTYVRAAIPDALAANAVPQARAPARAPRRVLSARGRLLAARPFPKLCSNRCADTFQLGRPALDAFPMETWSRLAASRLDRHAAETMTHGEPLGFPPLRAAIA